MKARSKFVKKYDLGGALSDVGNAFGIGGNYEYGQGGFSEPYPYLQANYIPTAYAGVNAAPVIDAVSYGQQLKSKRDADAQGLLPKTKEIMEQMKAEAHTSKLNEFNNEFLKEVSKLNSAIKKDGYDAVWANKDLIDRIEKFPIYKNFQAEKQRFKRNEENYQKAAADGNRLLGEYKINSDNTVSVFDAVTKTARDVSYDEVEKDRKRFRPLTYDEHYKFRVDNPIREENAVTSFDLSQNNSSKAQENIFKKFTEAKGKLATSSDGKSALVNAGSDLQPYIVLQDSYRKGENNLKAMQAIVSGIKNGTLIGQDDLRGLKSAALQAGINFDTYITNLIQNAALANTVSEFEERVSSKNIRDDFSAGTGSEKLASLGSINELFSGLTTLGTPKVDKYHIATNDGNKIAVPYIELNAPLNFQLDHVITDKDGNVERKAKTVTELLGEGVAGYTLDGEDASNILSQLKVNNLKAMYLPSLNGKPMSPEEIVAYKVKIDNLPKTRPGQKLNTRQPYMGAYLVPQVIAESEVVEQAFGKRFVENSFFGYNPTIKKNNVGLQYIENAKDQLSLGNKDAYNTVFNNSKILGPVYIPVHNAEDGNIGVIGERIDFEKRTTTGKTALGSNTSQQQVDINSNIYSDLITNEQ